MVFIKLIDFLLYLAISIKECVVSSSSSTFLLINDPLLGWAFQIETARAIDSTWTWRKLLNSHIHITEVQRCYIFHILDNEAQKISFLYVQSNHSTYSFFLRRVIFFKWWLCSFWRFKEKLSSWLFFFDASRQISTTIIHSQMSSEEIQAAGLPSLTDAAAIKMTNASLIRWVLCMARDAWRS